VVAVSAEGAEGAVSRHTNTNKSVNAATPEIRHFEETARSRKINRAVADFVTAYPRLANVEVATEPGTKVREAYADVEREEWVENQPDEPRFEVESAAKGTDVTDVTAVEWADAVRIFAGRHATTEETTINMEYSTPTGPELDAWSFAAENRWMASYQGRQHAQLTAWLRELFGGERPSGAQTEPTYDNPQLVLLTRSASSVPDGERVGPIDHAQALRDAWEPCYHQLRNTMRSLGLNWQYTRRMEPHTSKRGGGTNTAYAHEHVVLAVDGDVSVDDLRPVIDKHVEACEWATADAHQVSPAEGEGAVEIRDADDLTAAARYVADYCSIEEVSLWERSPAYVGWAAAMTAGNVRVMSRSEAARAAAKADACKQRAESAEADQTAMHGEEVRRAPGGEVVCAHCETAHDIEAETLTAARVSGPMVADGGADPTPGRTYTDEEVRAAWPSADAAAVIGEPVEEERHRRRVRRARDRSPDASVAQLAGEVGLRPREVREHLRVLREGIDPSSVRGFDATVPRWRVKSVTVAGEERPASAGHGIEMVSVRDERARLMERLESGQRYRCECGTAAYGSDMAAHLLTHGDDAELVWASVSVEATGPE
jgi:hypothetical protein